MLRGITAKTTKLVTGFLIVCGITVIAIKAFAWGSYSEVLTSQIDNDYEYGSSSVVLLDGSEDASLSLRLDTRVDSRIYSLSGTFQKPESQEQTYYNSYIWPADLQSGALPSDVEEAHDMNTGSFSFECNTIEGCAKIDTDSTIYTMTYTISKDTPVGVYNMPITISNLQTLDEDGNYDIHEEDITFNIQITIKRPYQITFYNSDYEPITEITRHYGDDRFSVIREVSDGGSIASYYVDNESGEEAPVYILDGSEEIIIHRTGDAKICASTNETEYYVSATSCYEVHIEKRLVWVNSVIIADKTYDGTTNAELSEIYFGDMELDESEYSITNITLDNPNVGSRMASFDIALTELGNSRYELMDGITSSPALVHHATLSDLTATIASQTYDSSVSHQTVPATVTAMFNGEEITLSEGVDYELLYHGQKIYSEVGLKEAGTYDITISPLMSSSNFLFNSFDEPFTINPKVVSVTDVQIDDKVYNESNEVSINSVNFGEDKLSDRYDYETFGTLDGINVGTWNAEVYIVLRNSNYVFYDEQTGTYSDHIVYNVPNVEIIPRQLTSDNAYYEFDDRTFDYTGERIEPIIPLFADVHGSHDSSELVFSRDYTIEYSDDTINHGTKYATLIGQGNFTGSLGPIEYYINLARLEEVEATAPDKVYTGEVLEPEPIVTGLFNGNRITLPSKEYVVSQHDDFVEAGSYSYMVMESNDSNYHFSSSNATFRILPHTIVSSDISLSESTYRYDGNSHIPDVTVTVGNTTLDHDSYDVKYSSDTIGNDESDTIVTVTVTAKDNSNISGEASTTYVITPREVLTISGIEDNQQIVYTGGPVVLNGNVAVAENPGGITADDLTIKWFADDGVTVIDRPSNAGSYKVIYSYEDADYRGSLVVNFEITKASSPSPAEVDTEFKIAAGQTLGDLEGVHTTGFAWTNSETVVTKGNNAYAATYTYDGDADNYETLYLSIPVYGLARIHVNVAQSEGGEIAMSDQDVLEGDNITVTILPDSGHVLDSITINNIDYTNRVDANTLTITAGADDIDVVATFVQVQYEVIEGAEQMIDLSKDDVAVFRIDADYELFANGGLVYVDDALVDSENYNSWEGSTYVQLTDDYLNGLSIGIHALKIAFNDGGIATTTFVITKSESEGGDGSSDSSNEKVPNTGYLTMDSNGATAMMGVFVVIAIVPMALRKICK